MTFGHCRSLMIIGGLSADNKKRAKVFNLKGKVVFFFDFEKFFYVFLFLNDFLTGMPF